MKLIDVYNAYKEEFKKTGNRPHPAKLLALLMLYDKEKYRISNFNFYLDNKRNIDIKIDKVIEDFNISKEEIIDMLSGGNDEVANVIRSDYTLYKILKYAILFYSGYKIVEWGNRYFESATPEEVYLNFKYYYGDDFLPTNKIKGVPILKKIRKGLKERGNK